MKQKRSDVTFDGPVKYRVNLTLILVTVLVLATAIPAVYFWHQRLIVSLSQALIDQAQVLIDEAGEENYTDFASPEFATQQQKLDEAVDLISRFLAVSPDDSHARIMLAKTFDRTIAPNPQRNVDIHLEAVAVTEGDQQRELRFRVGELLLESERYSETRKVAHDLYLELDESSIPDFRNRVVWLLAKAVAGEVQGAPRFNFNVIPKVENRFLGEWMQEAIDRNPNEVRLPVNLAVLYREPKLRDYLAPSQIDTVQSMAALADQLVDDMLERNRDNPEAYLADYQYKSYYQLDDAEKELQAAFELVPDNIQINFILGNIRLLQTRKQLAADSKLDDASRTRLQEARGYFMTCIEGNETMVEAYAKAGEVELLLEQTDQAIEIWTTGYEKSDQTDQVIFQQLVLALINHSDVDPNRLTTAEIHIRKMHTLIDELARNASTDPAELESWVQAKNLLGGYLFYKQGKVFRAQEILEQVVLDNHDRQNTYAAEANRILSEMYSDFGQPHRTAEKFEQLSRQYPNRLDYQRQAATSRMAAGQVDKAVDILRKLVVTNTRTADQLQYANALYFQQFQYPEDYRDWSKFDEAFEKVQSLNLVSPIDESWRIGFLGALADLAKIKNQSLENTNQVLEKLISINAENDIVPRQLAIIYNNLGEVELSDKWIDQYAERISETGGPDDLDQLSILKAELQISRGEFEDAGKILDVRIQAPESRNKTELQIAKIYVGIRSGDQEQIDAALTQIERLVLDNPANSRMVTELANQSIVFDRIKPKPQEWEKHLTNIEPPEGPFQKYFEATRLLKQAENTNDVSEKTKLLHQANNLRKQIARTNEDWSLLQTLAGDIYSALWLATPKTDKNQAASYQSNARQFYDRAVEFGDRRPSVLARLASLENNPVEAKKWIAMIGQRVPASSQALNEIKLQVAVRDNDLETARAAAEQITNQKPDDARAWTFRAILEIKVEQWETAKQFADKAIEFADADSDPLVAWQGVFNYYVAAANLQLESAERRSYLDSATQLIDKIVSLTEPENQLFIKAQLLDVVGDPVAAETYLAAEKTDSDNIEWLETMAEYFSSHFVPNVNCLDEAIRISKKIVNEKPARRAELARLLARRGKIEDWRMINSMYGANSDVTASGLDPRSFAVLLLYKLNVTNSERTANLEQARSIMMRFVEDSRRPGAADYVLLGQIASQWANIVKGNLRQEKIDEANEHFELAMKSTDVLPSHLFTIGAFFIEQQDFAKAEDVLRQLEFKTRNLAPPKPLALALRSRLIDGRDQENKQQTIRDLVNQFVQLTEKSENRLTDTQRIELHVAMASIFNGVEMPGDAIAWYRKAAELNPMLALNLSQVLAKNGRQQEGVSILIEGYQTADDINKIKYVSAICNILTVGVPSRELVMMAEPVFQSALSNFPNDIELLVNLANVRYVAENRFDDAVALYQEARRLLPNSPGLLNNLATILSDEPSMLDDALATINEAIDKGGKVPTLLDTKAVILAKMGRRKEAKDMLDNIVHSNADARYWWHLSEVEFQLFEAERNPTYLKSAKKSFELAKTNGLDQQILTPGETRRISELNKKLAQLDGTN